MAGASAGLSDNFASSAQNPAGPALTLEGGGIQVNHNQVRDAQIQSEADPLTARSYGVIFNEYPWGFSAGEWRIYSEGEGNLPTVAVSETRLQISRLFLESKRLSLGVGLIMGQGREVIDRITQADRAFGMGFGLQYRMVNRVVMGLSYTTPMEFAFGALNTDSSAIPNFFQPIHLPWRTEAGLGWIPNRFLRLGLSFEGIGPSKEAALVADESRRLGARWTLQPRTGLIYRFAEFRNFDGSVGSGTYYEVSRLEGADNRFHLTGGLELKPWILSIGAAMDHAPRYQNAILTVAVDIVQLLKRLNLIHRTYQPPSAGWFPDPFILNDDGLDHGLVDNYKDHKNPGIIENVRDFPERLQKRIEDVPSDIKEWFSP